MAFCINFVSNSDSAELREAEGLAQSEKRAAVSEFQFGRICLFPSMVMLQLA